MVNIDSRPVIIENFNISDAVIADSVIFADRPVFVDSVIFADRPVFVDNITADDLVTPDL